MESVRWSTPIMKTFLLHKVSYRPQSSLLHLAVCPVSTHWIWHEKCVQGMSVCVCVFVCVSGAPACQLPVCSAQSGKKAKPNYRHTATDLAGMLTRTGAGEEGEEGWKGGDGLEKSRLDGRFTRADRRDQAEGLGGLNTISGSGALIIYHRARLGEGRKQAAIDSAHLWKRLFRTKPPTQPHSTPPCPHPLPHVRCCLQHVQNITLMSAQQHFQITLCPSPPPWVPWVSSNYFTSFTFTSSVLLNFSETVLDNTLWHH